MTSPPGPPTSAPEPIRDDQTLGRLAEEWARGPAIAVDTEFVRERTFYPRLGLIQVADDQRAVLLDPLALDLTPLRHLLADPSVVKVLHSASEDVEVFFHRFGETPRNLFDTQVAAAFAGLGSSLGYAALVRTLFAVDLPKGETRTDWLRRPLSEAQRRYAIQDVVHLLPAWRHLHGSLAALGRLAWLTEDLGAIVEETRFLPDPENAWRRIKGAGSLDRRGLAVLQRLAAWRDGEARRRDLPRGFVLADPALVEIARRRPRDERALRRLGTLGPSSLRLCGKALTDLVVGDGGPTFPAPLPPVGHPSARDILLDLKDVVTSRAAELELPTELLATSSELKELVASSLGERDPVLPARLAGWRREVVGGRLLEGVRRHRQAGGGAGDASGHGESTHAKGASKK